MNPLRAAARWVGRQLGIGRVRAPRQTGALRRRAAAIRAKYDAAQTNNQNKKPGISFTNVHTKLRCP